jgi:hypothetical protein
MTAELVYNCGNHHFDPLQADSVSPPNHDYYPNVGNLLTSEGGFNLACA